MFFMLNNLLISIFVVNIIFRYFLGNYNFIIKFWDIELKPGSVPAKPGPGSPYFWGHIIATKENG